MKDKEIKINQVRRDRQAKIKDKRIEKIQGAEKREEVLVQGQSLRVVIIQEKMKQVPKFDII